MPGPDKGCSQKCGLCQQVGHKRPTCPKRPPTATPSASAITMKGHRLIINEDGKAKATVNPETNRRSSYKKRKPDASKEASEVCSPPPAVPFNRDGDGGGGGGPLQPPALQLAAF